MPPWGHSQVGSRSLRHAEFASILMGLGSFRSDNVRASERPRAHRQFRFFVPIGAE